MAKTKLLTARLKVGDSHVEISDIFVCRGLHKGIGMMFTRAENAKALLFEFDHDTSASITSLFCPSFLAIWLDSNNKIVEYKIVSSNKFSVSPSRKFRKLIEVPINKKYSHAVDFILDRGKV
jgi:uncharacterized membrane protein (UPF0127 family)